MRVATWCIDGVRGRLDVLCHWLERRRPDVVALQKIRAPEAKFPKEELARAGYRSKALRGQSLYGVALLSRSVLPPLEILDRGLPGGDGQDDGLLTARVGDLVVSSVYAPYGNPKKRGFAGALAHKVCWLDRLIGHLGERRTASDRRVVCGDFNVRPDVCAKPGILNRTSEEKTRLQALRRTGFVDLYRASQPVSGSGLQLRLQSPDSAHGQVATDPRQRGRRGIRGVCARRLGVPRTPRRASGRDLARQRSGDRGSRRTGVAGGRIRVGDRQAGGA